jgi:ribosome-associated protein
VSADLVVNDRVVIPARELIARATRSGGAGGQHVNTSSTRIELTWNVRETNALSPEERERVLRKLASRLDSSGAIRVVASARRSQRQNRALAEARLAMLLQHALREPKKRRATQPTAASRAARLESKKRHSRKKAGRKVRSDD